MATMRLASKATEGRRGDSFKEGIQALVDATRTIQMIAILIAVVCELGERRKEDLGDVVDARMQTATAAAEKMARRGEALDSLEQSAEATQSTQFDACASMNGSRQTRGFSRPVA